MSAIIRDNPISHGLALEVLRGLRIEHVGLARRKVRELRDNPEATSTQIELAEEALEDAREAAARSQRMSDHEARAVLEQEGIPLCRS